MIRTARCFEGFPVYFGIQCLQPLDLIQTVLENTKLLETCELDGILEYL
jgi:hypothetical protein